MTRIRGAAIGLAIAALAAGAGALSTARAQASGNLRASVTVLDDLVSRRIAAQVEAFVMDWSASSRPATVRLRPDSRDGVAAKVRELERIGRLRRLRVEIVYLY